METPSALRALGALAQPTRLALFRHLVERGAEGACAGSLAESLGVAAATLSFHLKELSHAGLVGSAQEGRFVRYTANLDAVQALVGYLTENCCGGDPSKCMPLGVSAPHKTARKSARTG